jgi:hypothetical protein
MRCHNAVKSLSNFSRPEIESERREPRSRRSPFVAGLSCCTFLLAFRNFTLRLLCRAAPLSLLACRIIKELTLSTRLPGGGVYRVPYLAVHTRKVE